MIDDADDELVVIANITKLRANISRLDRVLPNLT